MISEGKMRSGLISVVKDLEEKGFLPGASGNMSVRLNKTTILITPRGTKKGKLKPSDLVEVSLGGRLLRGSKSPSTELEMHLAIYRHVLEARVVLHAHPPFATAFAVAGLPFDHLAPPEMIESLGRIPLVPYGRSSTKELSHQLVPYLKNQHAFILADHGAVVYGDNLDEAYCRMESLEFCAKVAFLGKLISG